jgi:lipopolysaccharide biosynthesis glycosyltransferase
MNLAFTICSNNYLAQAKTLGDSLLKHNPGHKFIIVLVDRKTPQIDYSFFEPYEIVLIEDVGIQDFESIWKKYNIVELNTAVKPTLFKYFFKKYAELDNAFYFDPDIMIFRSL